MKQHLAALITKLDSGSGIFKEITATIYELMNYAEVQYCNEWTSTGQISITPSATTTTPTYFTPVEIAGIDASPFEYGGLVPLVAIYQINYPAYYNATGTTGTG